MPPVVADHIAAVAKRLDLVLAAGWRNADADIAALRELMAAVDQLGLANLLAQLRAVVEARPEDRLAAVASARLACRLLLLRLTEDSSPSGSWELWSASLRAPAAERLAPVGRVALGEAEAWACVRMRGFSNSLVLVEPPGDAGPFHSWLGRTLRGRTRWLARYPLGASGDVPLVALEEYQPVLLQSDEEHSADRATNPWRSLDFKKLADGKQVLGPGSHLSTKKLGIADADGCAWPDSAMAAAFRAAVARDPAWTLTWIEGPLVTPLAIIQPPGFLSPARVVYLVHGNPSDRLET
jgi:hypothetical protein